MPISPATTTNPRGLDQARRDGLSRLRQGGNPFTFSVATAGSERDCLSFDVAELWDSQRADLRAVLALYRRPNEPTRLYPILGEPGAGKTHLLTTFQAEVRRQAEAEGFETLIVVADHFSPAWTRWISSSGRSSITCWLGVFQAPASCACLRNA